MNHLRRRCRLRDDRGFSLMELVVATMLGSVVLASLGGFLISSLNAGSFTEGHSATLNDARNAIQMIEKETRGAVEVKLCEPAGSCLQVLAQTPTSMFENVRYTHVGHELLREEKSSGSTTWGEPESMIGRLANTTSQPVFVCDVEGTFSRVNIDMHIEPTPQSDPNLNIHTSIHPRNSSGGCTPTPTPTP